MLHQPIEIVVRISSHLPTRLHSVHVKLIVLIKCLLASFNEKVKKRIFEVKTYFYFVLDDEHNYSVENLKLGLFG